MMRAAPVTSAASGAGSLGRSPDRKTGEGQQIGPTACRMDIRIIGARTCSMTAASFAEIVEVLPGMRYPATRRDSARLSDHAIDPAPPTNRSMRDFFAVGVMPRPR